MFLYVYEVLHWKVLIPIDNEIDMMVYEEK